MTPTQMARRSDALYADGTCGMTRRVLCDMVAQRESDLEDARAENAKLREYVERKRYLQDFARLVCENSKLRELVRDMWEGYYDPRCEECHLKDTPTCADCPICAREASVIDRMRELGVEVVMDERRRS